MPSSTTMPRLTARPASLARADAGRMPTAMTTMSPVMTRPSSSSMPSTLSSPRICFGIGLGDDLDAAFGQRLFKQIACGRVELALHQRRHQVEDRDVHALALQAGSRFQPEQAAADDDGAALALRDHQHGVDVVEIAIGAARRAVVAGNRDDEGQRAGGDDQLVVGYRDAVGGGDRLCVRGRSR